MQVTYNIVNMERLPEDGTVVRTGCVVVATERENYTNHGLPAEREFMANRYIVVEFQRNDETEFIPFEELSHEIVEHWIKDTLGTDGVASLEGDLQKQIDLQKIPKVVDGLPW